MGEHKNRLKELMELRNITVEELQQALHVGKKTIESYRNGNRQIPIVTAHSLADKYSITLDWLFCRNSFLDHEDVMVDILLALGKIFRIKRIKKAYVGQDEKIYYVNEMVLQIDKRFFDYISDVQKLENLKAKSEAGTTLLNEGDYKRKRLEVFLKHKEYLKSIFNNDMFNEDIEIQIADFEGITIVDLLGNAIDTSSND